MCMDLAETKVLDLSWDSDLSVGLKSNILKFISEPDTVSVHFS